MLLQVVHPAEVLEADVALEGLLAGVLADVARKVLGTRERHVAVLVPFAPEHLLGGVGAGAGAGGFR